MPIERWIFGIDDFDKTKKQDANVLKIASGIMAYCQTFFAELSRSYANDELGGLGMVTIWEATEVRE